MGDEDFMVARLYDILNSIQLKDMSALLLNNAIMTETRSFLSSSQRVMLTDAISLADLVHKGASRRTPMIGSNGKIRDKFTPYIEHPLRSALRLVRLGVTDFDTIVASVLHDTVEDNAEFMVDVALGLAKGSELIPAGAFDGAAFATMRSQFGDDVQSEGYTRTMAFEYVRQLFGNEVETIVHGVTNPLSELRGVSYHPIYHDHVKSGISDPRVFLVKYADLKDNALGLHFGDDKRMQKRLASKYRPLFPILLHEWDKGFVQDFLSEHGVSVIDKQLRGADSYLEQFLYEDVN